MAVSPTGQEPEERVEAYRRALRQEVGLGSDEVQHFRRPYERGWPLGDRGTTTIIYCGLTAAHEDISLGVLEGMGYKAQRLPIPDYEALAIGKEFCNRGQCNPTYYTVGTLLKFLLDLRRQGLSDSEIEERFALLWARDCG